ncbi:hypothetical protein F442_01912 [Phytophthora nicotianae P10297]|uniref:Uncharacterized protein n=5 Tax=Phytophthora nicotianae TaxID=4792 RepID=W2PDF1_PHYN3|nr:hypothetical protein PPTG_24493 [Phytophthora nicotianae INRA-310]ETI55355.1 hypothetical protein F443_01973 [Phytophthora nicotianae P1569]ETM01622.1 hypothetical protein L917_01808 [Phytophthora nicotianae]ETO84095.1 hypothetical protein F444_01972 [Phytophthora nicotianae P1976]ETP53170.1 hypothetical protein F442_01912 [Phytophthora nicotianae P10297]ETM54850.1 hypothetical protein L914_01866 [Phytophthora nicotianae]
MEAIKTERKVKQQYELMRRQSKNTLVVINNFGHVG